MPSSQRYKFNGSEIQLLTSYEASPGSMAVSAISLTNPAVATVDSSSIIGGTGDIGVVKFTSVEGMGDMDERVVIVQVASGTELTLLGVDASNYDAMTGSAMGEPGNFATRPPSARRSRNSSAG
jgi:putative protein kinase ArgK-like GTPase of G3E family